MTPRYIYFQIAQSELVPTILYETFPRQEAVIIQILKFLHLLKSFGVSDAPQDIEMPRGTGFDLQVARDNL